MKKLAAFFLALSLAFATPLLLLQTEAQGSLSCNSCESCSEYLQNGSLSPGDTLTLISDITGHSGTCISFGGADDITFDCSGHTISGSLTGLGIWLNDSDSGSNNNIIKDCHNISYFSGGIYLLFSNNNTIFNINSMQNELGANGIFLDSSSNNTVFNIEAVQNTYGIGLYNSSYNTLYDIDAKSNVYGGIILGSSNYNSFSDVMINDTFQEGLYLDSSSNNTISNATVTYNYNGIFFEDYCQDNIINDSRIEDNKMSGIEFVCSGPPCPELNTFYNNYINDNVSIPNDWIDNSWNMILDCSSGPNIIGGPCLGGNFWTNSTSGTGFSDTCTDSDSNGICDSPYTLNSASSDHLPLTLDRNPPVLRYVPPTPSNGQIFTNQDWVYINVSSNEPLSSCILDWNRTNETASISGSLCYKNKTGLANGNYTFRVYANDSSGNMNSTEERRIDIFNATALPQITNHEFHPPVIFKRDFVLIGVNATDDVGFDSLWANITEPNNAYHHLVLQNNRLVSWQANQSGTHSITIFAEDTSHNKVNVSDSFQVGEPFSLLINVTEPDETGLSSRLNIYATGTDYQVFSASNSSGRFNVILVDFDYDLRVRAFDNKLDLLLKEVHIDSGFDSYLSLDNPGATDDFELIFAVETDYEMNSSKVKIFYEDMSFDNLTNVYAYVCDDWNMTSSLCNNTWDKIENYTNDKDDEFIEFWVDSFSAYAVREDSYCGDDWCGPNESASSCPEDCKCDEGDTRPCNITHRGRCAVGTESCQDGQWSGCPSPVTESCNQEDDNCDGVIDNVGGGTSVAASKCQCFAGGTPRTESCNGIDDDCNGQIDNDADCCINGQTRNCGPSTEEGICKYGTSTCSGGVWGSCVGAVSPKDEVCFDELDNDCDGDVDEDCEYPDCEEGQINQTCICENATRDSGYCCSGLYYEDGCVESPWLILVIIGVIMLIGLVVLVLIFRRQGKELTWEELMKRYGSRPARNK